MSVKTLQFFYLQVLGMLSNSEFTYFKNNTNVTWRKRFLRASGVTFEEPISIGRDFYLREKGGLKVGRNASFGSYTRIWNYAAIEIGDHFLSAGGLTINCGSHDPLTLVPGGGPIKIGHRVWMGINVTILGGVTIGNDVVVGAGSVVTKDLPANAVYAGTPAKRIRDLDRSDLASIWGAWGPVELPPNPRRVAIADIQSRLDQGDVRGAYDAATQAIGSGVNDPSLWVMQAKAAVQLGLVEEFEHAMQSAMHEDPKFGPAHRLMGDLMSSGGQFVDAARHYSVAVSQAPEDFEVRVLLAKCLENAGMINEAAMHNDVIARMSRSHGCPGRQPAGGRGSV